MHAEILKYAPASTEAERNGSISSAELWYESNADMSCQSGGDKVRAITHYAVWHLTGGDSHLKIALKNLPRDDMRKLFTGL